MRSNGLIDEFLEHVRHTVNAQVASILIYSEPLDPENLMLLHCGTGAPVEELANQESALEFISSASPSTSPELCVVRSSTNSFLLSISLSDILSRPNATSRPTNERRSAPEISTAPKIDGTVWLGFSGCQDIAPLIQRFEGLDKNSGRKSSLMVLATKLAWSVYQLSSSLQDPVSQLPGRMEFQIFLRRALAAATESGQPLSLMLINPDDFTMVNHRYGRDQGDRAIKEIADELTLCLRQTDGVFRYAGAVFAVVMPATGRTQCKAAADKVRRHLLQSDYVGGKERFTFSIGCAAADVEDINQGLVENSDLLHHADVALNRAKLSGGAQVVVSSMSEADLEGVEANPLSGVFTADTEKDYRNMLLLWETVGLVTANPEPEAMAEALTDRLAQGFQPDRITLLNLESDGSFTPLAQNIRDDHGISGRNHDKEVKLNSRQIELVEAAISSRRVERWRHEHQNGTHHTAYAVPLIARDEPIACLYLDGRGRRLQLDSSDILFLNALASQMAVALDRARLATGWILEKDRESRQLKQELRDLKQVIESHKMIYVSKEMHELMETLQRVAPSQATVLITGESGTGKEMLAHALHEHSDRSNEPFVVFDCGAVAPSLLEAELFGHIKGAFTGAESASEGRIAQAHKGTLFLDEIGELPLQVQAKLLRFVQEKEYAPVGSATHAKVDVRIIAATNRKLQDEVAQGRFRADLYYRLQVISLYAIPLRHRQLDILPLADYYLERYAVQNDVPKRKLNEGAQQKLLAHTWPGNVRELQHSMLRAVLTANGEHISADAIELLPENPPENQASTLQTPSARSFEPSTNDAPQTEDDFPGKNHTNEPAEDDPWYALREELKRQIELAIEKNKSRPVPLGRWLTEDLVMAASEASDKVARRAASLVGLPESTFRRYYQKADAELSAGLATRTEEWQVVKPILDDLVDQARTQPVSQGDDLVDQARLTLLADVAQFVDGKTSVGAALMGVTAPTYKRWLADKEAGSNDAAT